MTMINEWVSMMDSAPPKPGRYLCYMFYQDTILLYYWNGKQWENNHTMTHWMLLPEKPANASKERIAALVTENARLHEEIGRLRTKLNKTRKVDPCDYASLKEHTGEIGC